MPEPRQPTRVRVLVIDDNRAIHEDFRKILGASETFARVALDQAETELFGSSPRPAFTDYFELDSAFQGQEGHDLVRRAQARGQPYMLAFVDVRMPPGWDGIRTIARLWDVDQDLQTVICTAYSDYSWDEMIERLGATDRLLVLKKPFDPLEVRQAACALAAKWQWTKRARLRLDELEQLVAERTSALQRTNDELQRLNVELATAKQQADAASRAKSLFVAHMSHEIRTPMTAILGFAETLQEPNQPDPERREAIHTIQRSGKHLLNLIDDILDLSKIESGRLDILREPCNLREVVAEVLALVGAPAREKGLALSAETIGPVPETIYTDPFRVRQILVNLLGNAIKFTDGGTVSLRVGLATPPSAGAPADVEPQVQFEVTDSGIGMTAEQLSRVFEPFIQADPQTTRKYGGSGLGLPISKRLAQLLGGDITVESTPGRGSVFRASIAAGPLDGVHLVESLALAPREGCGTPAGRTVTDQAPCFSAPCRILLAEDGEDNRRLLTNFLSKAGAQVALAPNGQVAIDMVAAAEARGEPFDLILMDMQMPELDGYAATRRLREMQYAGPIVALTAHACAGDREKCVQAGCNDYLAKPVRRNALLQMVQTWLAEPRVPRA